MPGPDDQLEPISFEVSSTEPTLLELWNLNTISAITALAVDDRGM